MGGKKRAFSTSLLASGVVAGSVGTVRVGIEGGAGGRKLFDLADLARCQILFPPLLLAFSSASSKLLRFAALIAALLAFMADMYSSFASWDWSHLHLLKAFLSSSTSFPIFSDHQGTRKGAGFERGTCCLVTSFIQETRPSTPEFMSEVERKLRGKWLSSWHLWATACLSACFRRGRGSKRHKEGVKDNFAGAEKSRVSE